MFLVNKTDGRAWIRCDQCGHRITDPAEAFYAYKDWSLPAGKKPAERISTSLVYHVHKGECATSFKVQHGPQSAWKYRALSKLLNAVTPS